MALEICENYISIGPEAAFKDMLKQRPDINPQCRLKTIGEPLLNMQSGWMAPGTRWGLEA